LKSVLKKHVIDEVIIAIPRSMLEDAEPIVIACEEEGFKLRFMADVFNVHVAKISLTMIGQIPLLTLESVAQDSLQLLFKRIFDFSVTLLAMPVVLPLLAVAGIAIKMDSTWASGFCSATCRSEKTIFSHVKLRSMHVDAEEN